MREQFGGSRTVSVVFQAETPELLLHPDSLAAMDGLGAYLRSRVPSVGKVMGFTDFIKRVNQVFNADADPAGLTKPEEDTFLLDDFGFGFWDFDDSAYTLLPNNGAPDIDSAHYTADAAIITQVNLLELLSNAVSLSMNMSANDFVWELRRQVNHEGASFFEIPLDPQRYGRDRKEELQHIIANYLVLLSGSIEDYANDSLEPTAMNSIIQMRTLGTRDTMNTVKSIQNYLDAHVPANITTIIGGHTIVEDLLNRHVYQSQLVTIFLSIVFLFIILSIAYRSAVAGCIAILPLSISIMLNFAVMGLAGIKLNIGTSLVACISIAIGIDYTIHYLETFKREFHSSGGSGDFLRRTFLSSGRAIIINAVSVGAGFAVLLFSEFNILNNLGLLISMSMFSSALVSLTVLPALLMVIKPKFITKTAAMNTINTIKAQEEDL
jgi:predicted RND superfamily exporter protein